MTERDTQVLFSIYQYRLLATSQVARLHFPSLRTAQRRLTALTGMKLVKPFRIANLSENIYQLTRRGAHEIAELLGATLDDLLWSEHQRAPKDYYFMRHFMAIADFRITLTNALQDSPLSLLGFIHEHVGKRHTSGRITKYVKDVTHAVSSPYETITHAPDGVFALTLDGRRGALCFLEIDRGTESISNPQKGIAKMIRFYEGYAKDKRYQSYTEDFECEPFKNFRLLFVTTSRKRIENIRSALGERAPRLYRLFWLTTSDAITESSILGNIWCSLDSNDTDTYSLFA